MTDNVNPYAAPLEPSAESGRPTAKTVIVDRLHFEGELTFEHHRDAVRKAGIRTDYRALKKLTLILGTILLLLIGLGLLSSGGTLPMITLVPSVLCFTAGIAVIMHNQRRLALVVLPALQTVLGKVSGWVDEDGVWVETKDQSLYHSFDSIVCSANNHDLWAISFFRQQLQWITLPFDHFSDPALARTVASDLKRLYPPTKPQVHDSRRWEPPTDEPRFQPADGHVNFDGEVYDHVLDGTLCRRWVKSFVNRTRISLVLMFGLMGTGAGLLLGFSSWFLLAGVVYMMLFFLFVWIMVWRKERQARRDGGTLLYYSKGWIDPTGYFAMTSIGQNDCRWSLFDQYEITDQVIALYPHPQQHFSFCVARNQFASDEHWDQACEMVRGGMS